MNNCLNCRKETKNTKFCSRSCANSFNNRIYPKRKLSKLCNSEGCDKIVKSYRHNLCDVHHKEYMKSSKERYKHLSIGEYRNKLSVKGKHVSWKHSHIRIFARKWLNHLVDLPCHNCNYSLHVELCHIKPVSSFPDEALLSEVNSEDNVIQLCRNCHWELDNGHLKLNPA